MFATDINSFNPQLYYRYHGTHRDCSYVWLNKQSSFAGWTSNPFWGIKSDFFGKHPRWGFMLLNLMLFMCSLGVSLELKALKMDSMYFGISARTPRDDFMFNISLIILWVKNFLEDVCALGVKASLMKKAFIEAFEACLLGIENIFWLAGALPFFYRALTFLLSCFDQRQNFLHCAVCAFIRPRTNF